MTFRSMVVHPTPAGSPALTCATAAHHVASTALRPTAIGPVGLELEAHLVDLARPGVRPGWERTTAALADLPALPGGSAVTVEPGGQVELSSPPCPDVLSAVTALRADRAVLAAALAEVGLGTALLGADPARAVQRVNPAGRYAAMESYFTARGDGVTGAAMMCSTASLQVNVDAGPPAGWADRVGLAHRLGPVLVALAGCSPLLAGRVTGWRSTRQQVWGELDQSRCGPLLGRDEPAGEWARYALRAPVMTYRDGATFEPLRRPVPFADWAAGRVRLGGRTPTRADLDYHLTTLFPPVRLRGFLEIRYLDATPDAWWPALAAVTVTLLDQPAPADLAADACAPVATAWTAAARNGLADPELRRAALSCLRAALPAVPPALRPDVERLAELAESGRSPGDALLDRAGRVGALAVLDEEARARA